MEFPCEEGPEPKWYDIGFRVGPTDNGVELQVWNNQIQPARLIVPVTLTPEDAMMLARKLTMAAWQYEDAQRKTE